MRGSRTFKTILKEGGLTGTTRKGRNNTLLYKRNECLIARYYHYGNTKNKCYEDILRMLVTEFYLSPNTISLIVTEHTEQLQDLKKECHPLSHFQNRWPHLKW